MIKLETERLILRTGTAEDAPHLHQYYTENLEFFSEYSPDYPFPIKFLPFHVRWLELEEQQLKDKARIRFYLYMKGATNEDQIVGDFCFGQVSWGGFLSCSLGYKMHQDFTGQGLCTEAIEAGIKYLFEQWKLHRIEASIMPANLGSVRIVEKLGFQYQGLAPKFLKIGGNWEDHGQYVKFNPEVE